MKAAGKSCAIDEVDTPLRRFARTYRTAAIAAFRAAPRVRARGAANFVNFRSRAGCAAADRHSWHGPHRSTTLMGSLDPAPAFFSTSDTKAG
jgi:hypothetical protein